MTYSLLYNDMEYIGLSEEHSFKFRSLEDNVYFTLRDIFLNVIDIEYVLATQEFCIELTGGIPYHERTDTFQYTDILSDKDFNKRLSKWFSTLDKKCFDFNPPQKDDVIDLKEFILFDEWWRHFVFIRRQILCKSQEEQNSFL